MKTVNLIQGSPEWKAHRAQHFNASDAPAMLGCSPYTTRAQLLHQLHTGLPPEVDPATQRRFDDGHRYEALARPIAEEIIGDDLAPVTGVLEGTKFSASFDGLTMMGDTAFEHKTLNQELRGCMRDQGNGYDLPKQYQVQMEQQLLVSGAERVLFMASEWTGDGALVEERHCWYASNPALRAEILSGWEQFEQDLCAYAPTEAVPAAVAAPIEALPAVSVRMDGALAVVSNLDVFGTALRAFVAKIPAKPTSDQEFADADAACKALKKAEEALDGAEANALGQVQSVETLTRTIGDLRTVARTARLATEKLVKARKEQIRAEEVQRGRDALTAHVVALDNSLGRPLMPPIVADFGGAISGKKTLDSLRNAIDTELARAKIAANETAERIRGNLKLLDAQPEHLIRDINILAHKAPDDLQAVIAARLAEEERRQNAERERIRREEADRLEREAAARAAEAARATQAPAPTQPPAPVVNEAPAVSSQAANVVPLGTRAPAETGARLRLGEINSRLAPIALTAEGLATLGFQPVATEKAAKLYRAADLDRICASLVSRLVQVREECKRVA